MHLFIIAFLMISGVDSFFASVSQLSHKQSFICLKNSGIFWCYPTSSCCMFQRGHG